MKDALTVKGTGLGSLVCAIPCLFWSLQVKAGNGNAGNIRVQVFDSNKKPNIGDVPCRSILAGPDAYAEIRCEGGRKMYQGIYVAITGTADVYTAEIESGDLSNVVDISFEIPPPPPAPPSERLPDAVELPKVKTPDPISGAAPVTLAASRPAITSKPTPR